MSGMEQISQESIQAKVFDLAIAELICSKRNCFEPLWTIDSWVKFLIWLALNVGFSGERKSLEIFVEVIGQPLTYRMRKIFFERRLEDFSIHLIADPAEGNVLVMPLDMSDNVSNAQVVKALENVGLHKRVSLEINNWKVQDQLILIPWKDLENDS